METTAIAFTEAERYLLQLADKTEFDFYGLSHLDPEARRLRWIWTYGSISNKTKHIHHRIGSGITGAAIRAGRMIVLDPSHAKTEHLRSEEPVMLSESLQAAAAVVIGARNDEHGVLLVGRRKPSDFTDDELRALQCSAVQMSGAIHTIICQP